MFQIPKIVHLAGLNLNRAWCLHSVAMSLHEKDALRDPLLESARKHLSAGLGYVNSGHLRRRSLVGHVCLIRESACWSPSEQR